MGKKRGEAPYHVWLSDLSVKPPRVVRKGKATDGGSMVFSGYSESQDFSRVTTVRDAIKTHVFFEDFKSISRPEFKAVEWDDGREPDRAGRFAYDLTLKPLGSRASEKKKSGQ
jgi:hypothetical protein